MLADQGVEVWIAAGTGRDERMLVDRILRDSRGAAIPAPETRSFDDLLALLGRTSVFVSGDTGPLHAASLHGVPVVQLLGPTHPVHNEPWSGTPSRRLHVPLACSPCRKGCPDVSCMKAISPTAVVEAILELRAAHATRSERAASRQFAAVARVVSPLSESSQTSQTSESAAFGPSAEPPG
jgi:ADP-heptose:LPS heptosyltransferase